MEQKLSVNIYEKPDYCPQCNMTKKEFKRRLGQAVYDSLVTTQELTSESTEQFKAMGFMSAPIVEISSKVTPEQVESADDGATNSTDTPDNVIDRWAGYRPDRIKAVAEVALALTNNQDS